MEPNYMSLMKYGSGYQPMTPLELTQPEPLPSWMPAPVQRTFPMATASAPAVAPVANSAGNGGWFGGGLFSGGLGASETVPGYSVPTLGSSPAQPGGSNWFKDSGFLSQKNADGTMSQGWGGLALGGAQALGSLFMGMQQYNLAKDTLAANKDQFEKNFAAQKTTTNAALEDRQRARVAANPGAYQSVGEYMNRNGVR